MSDAARNLQLETRAAQQLRDVLLAMGCDDSKTLADTIEGETDIREAIRRVYWAMIEDQILIDGLTENIQVLQARKTRIETRVERYRAAIEKGMSAGEISKLELPEATISLRAVAPKLEVVIEALIPERFWIPQPNTLDKKALLTALKEPGADIPGAALSNGGQSLSIRRA